MKKILTLILVIVGSIPLSAQNTNPISNYQLPYRTQTDWLRIMKLPQAQASDSILAVMGSNYRYLGRVSINDYGFIKSDYTGFDNRYKSINYSPDLSAYYLSSNPSGFISSYTETDPVWSNQKSQYSTTAQANSLYKPANYSVTYASLPDKPVIPTNNNQLTNGAGFISSYTETDPIWSSQKTAYSTKSEADILYKPASYVPTSAQVISALGYTPAAVTAPVVYGNSPARTIGTSYTLSSTRAVRVSYSCAIATVLTLVNLNSSARVYLEISSNAGSTWSIINSAGVTKVLGAGLALTETSYLNVSGEVPINNLVRLRSVLSGGGTAVFDSGQEVIY